MLKQLVEYHEQLINELIELRAAYRLFEEQGKEVWELVWLKESIQKIEFKIYLIDKLLEQEIK
jgi:hypothetical protein